MNLPFAGLHLLLHPFADRFDALPPLQADALRSALGMGAGPVDDPFLVGLAVLGLLAELSEDRPLVCLIDDVQWIDQASLDALTFAARRLEAEPVALVFAGRDEGRSVHLPGTAELRPQRLSSADTTRLLEEQKVDLASDVRERIVEEAQGNPLALIELTAALTPEQRAGRAAIAPTALPANGRVQKAFMDRIADLPAESRDLLLVAAADDTGDAALVLKAAQHVGAALESLQPLEQGRLLRLTDRRLTFRHPLIRAAAYQGAPLTQRLAAHRALAESLEGPSHADRRAWHLAAAATEPDEEVAAALERAAENARIRSGTEANAAEGLRIAQDTSQHHYRSLLTGVLAYQGQGLEQPGESPPEGGPRARERITDRRRDFLHKLTTRLVRENQTVVLEDLTVPQPAEEPHPGARHLGRVVDGTALHAGVQVRLVRA